MNKLLPVIAFSVLLLIPVGAQNAFAMEQTSGPVMDGTLEVILPGGITGKAAPLYTTQNAPANYVVPPGGNLDGVADLLLSDGIITIRCTGSLLESDPTGGDFDTVVLTAAHCVDFDLDGTIDITSGTAEFEGAGGSEFIALNVPWTMIEPNWNGDFTEGNDIAIVELVSAPSSSITRNTYDTNPAGDLNIDADQVGFGRSGMMSQGDILASGTKRAIVSDIDGDAGPISNAFGNAAPVPNYGIVTDGDSGLPSNDACAFWGLCAAGLGNGASEGHVAGGDSGGPTYAQSAPNVVMGVASWGGTFFDQDCTQNIGLSPMIPGQSDINCILDSSHGEFGVFTRVSTYSGWVTNTLISMNKLDPGMQPEPPMQPTVAGELSPIDSKALLVAGAQMNAVWIIPMIVAAAAIGIIVSRRF